MAMADKPDRKRWGLWIVELVAALLSLAAYLGAYYATDTPRAGLIVGHPPRYMIGPYGIPNTIAEPFFAPADWIDEAIRQTCHKLSG
jgi:hypothetical protein